MTTEIVSVETLHDRATIWINRPEKRNALDPPMMQALDDAVNVVAELDTPLIIRSASAGMFVAGADLATLRQRSLADSLNRTAARLFARIAGMPVPTIAAVDGHALGGGCELALACDFRISTPGALWGLPEVTLGLIPSAGGLTRLRETVGSARARDLALTGRIIDGAEAHQIGLATRIADGGLSVEVDALLDVLSRNGNLAMRLAKEALRHHDDDRLVDALAQAALIGTDDAQSRIAVFLEKRG